jgi:hypothetical protein
MELEQQAIKANLDGTPVIDDTALYYIDFSKLQRIEDLILILAAIGFTFSPRHPHFELLKPFVNLGQPIYPNQQPVKNDIKLPKLKKVEKNGE